MHEISVLVLEMDPNWSMTEKNGNAREKKRNLGKQRAMPAFSEVEEKFGKQASIHLSFFAFRDVNSSVFPVLLHAWKRRKKSHCLLIGLVCIA